MVYELHRLKKDCLQWFEFLIKPLILDGRMLRGLYWFSCHSFHSFYFIRQKENGSYVNTRHKRQINAVHYIKWYKALFLDNQTAYFVGDIALRHQPAAGWPPVSTRHSPGYTHAQAIYTKCSSLPVVSRILL
jgi:hypothetical protein